jgi:hypothetical protein
MKVNAGNEKTSDVGAAASNSGLKPYERPVLQYYGSLNEIAQGPGASANEGGGNDPNDRRRRPTGT